MHILVINSGSSSLKFKLFDMKTQKVLIQGIVEKIGSKGSFLEYEVKKKKIYIDAKIASHEQAFQRMSIILQTSLGGLKSISAVGHRVVHGGDFFKNATIITDKVIKKIEQCADMAPLHDPANLQGIYACQKLLPKIPQVAVFDTAFFQNMKPANFVYPIPYDFYTKHQIRRYGFHGTSHKYVYQRLTQIQKGGKKVITCHIGNGASMTAIQGGVVVETSMGFTPLEGLMMGTRSGNIDPAIATYLMKHEKYSPQKMEDILDKESGLLGVSGISSDMRDILAASKKGNKRAQLALDIYINSIVKYIGAYVSLMNGVDTIVLTAGVMERSKIVRKLLLERLSRLGIKLDSKKNDFDTQERKITSASSKVKVRVIPTNEELQIARETQKLS